MHSLSTLPLSLSLSKGSYLILSGQPLNESIVRQGPFITNTEVEMKNDSLEEAELFAVSSEVSVSSK